MILPKITEWTQEEAEIWFKKIEEDKGRGEWYDIDWKETTSFDDTVHKKNTTQKAISGFANTYGGKIIIGFTNTGEPKGFKNISDIENHLRRKLENKIVPTLPFFRARYYKYNEKDFLAIFIARSKIPLQCDNGVYYYREQSEFKFMPHYLLESKFRRCFDEEKYLFLVASELRQLIDYAESMRRKLLQMRHTTYYKISILSKTFLKSGEMLYNFYEENDILRDYDKLSEIIRLWCIEEMGVLKELTHFKNLKEDVEKFYKKLEEARVNEDVIKER